MSSWFRGSVLPTMLVCLLGALLSGCAPSSAARESGAGVAEDETRTMDSAEPPTPMSPGDGDDAKNAASHEITIDNFAFKPRKLTVSVGAKVTWINHDDVPHTATSTKKPRLFDSGTLDTDDKYSRVFTTPGTYEYFCAVHPHMTGQIIVK
jgi:plastocyanin